MRASPSSPHRSLYMGVNAGDAGCDLISSPLSPFRAAHCRREIPPPASSFRLRSRRSTHTMPQRCPGADQSGVGAARLAVRGAPMAPEATTMRRGRGAPTPRGCGAHTTTQSTASPRCRHLASGRLGPTGVAARRHQHRRRPPAPATVRSRPPPLPPQPHRLRLPLACGWRWTRPLRHK
jgi:hypothetical protein